MYHDIWLHDHTHFHILVHVYIIKTNGIFPGLLFLFTSTPAVCYIHYAFLNVVTSTIFFPEVYPAWYFLGGCLGCGRFRGRFLAESAPICIVQVAFQGYCPAKGGGKLPVNSIYRLWRHCHLLVVGDCNLSYPFTSVPLLQVVDNWLHEQW